jgi:hypothetical protein
LAAASISARLCADVIAVVAIIDAATRESSFPVNLTI